MTRFRFVHTADLHLDSPLKSLALRDPALAEATASASRRVLERIVDICMEEEADALLVAGDLYDGSMRSMKTAAFLTRQMQRLFEAGIAVFMIRGNHDAESTITRQLALPPNVHVFAARGGVVRLEDKGVAIHGVSFRDSHVPESLLSRFQTPVAGLANIALLHTSLAGAPGHDVYAPCTVAELAAIGMDYWALGHVHRRQVHSANPLIVMPGMPQGRDIGESGAKSVTVADVGDDGISISERMTSVVEFGTLEHDLSGHTDWQAAMAAVHDAMTRAREASSARELVLRHAITASGDFGWRLARDLDLAEATIRDAGEAIGHVWLDKLVSDIVSGPGAASETGSTDPVVRLGELMEGLCSDPAFLGEAQGDFSALLADLPPALRDRFGDGEESQRAVMETLLHTGTRTVLARLSRGPSGDGA